MDNLKNKTGLIKVELNDYGDYIVISVKDTTVLEKYKAALQEIVKESGKMSHNLTKIERSCRGLKRTVEMSRARVKFSENATRIFDDVFGEGTIKKYFRKLYEEVPDFIPNEDCFSDFINHMTPVIEKLFE